MFRAFLATVLLLAASTSQADSLVARRLGTPVSRNVLYMAQEVSIAGTQSESAKIGPLTTSTAGFGIEKNTVKLNALPVIGLPRVSVANPTTQTDALTAANMWAASNMPSFQSRIATYVRSKGLSSAFYSFTQEINVSTAFGTKRQAIGFNVTVDPNGRPLYGAPKIVDPDPLILEAMYTPASAVSGLPSNWTFPNAGTIKYRIMNKSYVPLTGYYIVNVGGAFDSEPDAADPDAKLRCLMDRRYAGCAGVGSTDIYTIAGQVGASLAIVDYVRQLEPAYDQMADGSLVAKGAISYDARYWDCLNYTNIGYFGYVLNMRAERYSMVPGATTSPYQMLQMFSGKTISPTESFNKSVPISALNGASPAGFVIAANPGDNSLWSVNDPIQMHNVVYLAPVRAQGADGTINFTGTTNSDTQIQQTSSVGNIREYYIGMVCTACWTTGQYDRSVTFDVANPATLDELAITQEGFDDWLSVTVNGTTVFVGPKGGDMLYWNRGTSATETDCSYTGSGYTCNHTAQATAYDNNGYPLPPSSGCSPVYTYDSETGNQYTSWSCPTTYQHCSPTGGYGGERDSGYTYWSCSNSPCPDDTVQFMSNASADYVPSRGVNNGCGSPELATSWRFNTYIDLRPYLRSGSNTISLRTITYGTGEGFVRVRSQACGASLGLTTGAAPPVPSTGGSGGVTNNVYNNAR